MQISGQPLEKNKTYKLIAPIFFQTVETAIVHLIMDTISKIPK